MLLLLVSGECMAFPFGRSSTWRCAAQARVATAEAGAVLRSVVGAGCVRACVRLVRGSRSRSITAGPAPCTSDGLPDD